jgi:hypothetical protein
VANGRVCRRAGRLGWGAGAVSCAAKRFCMSPVNRQSRPHPHPPTSSLSSSSASASSPPLLPAGFAPAAAGASAAAAGFAPPPTPATQPATVRRNVSTCAAESLAVSFWRTADPTSSSLMPTRAMTPPRLRPAAVRLGAATSSGAHVALPQIRGPPTGSIAYRLPHVRASWRGAGRGCLWVGARLSAAAGGAAKPLARPVEMRGQRPVNAWSKRGQRAVKRTHLRARGTREVCVEEEGEAARELCRVAGLAWGRAGVGSGEQGAGGGRTGGAAGPGPGVGRGAEGRPRAEQLPGPPAGGRPRRAIHP